MPDQRGWLTDLRKTAFLNCIFGGLSAIVPGMRLLRQLQESFSSRPDLRPLTMLVGGGEALLILYVLAFFWAVYRDQGQLVLSYELRIAALAAAIVFVTLQFNFFSQWSFGIREDWSFLTQRVWRAGAASVRAALQDQVISREFTNSSAAASVVCYELFLIALFRQTGEDVDENVPPSKFLVLVSRTGLVVGAIIVAFLFFRLCMTPSLYRQFREMAAQVGRTPPPYARFLWGMVRDLLDGLCYFTAVFLIFKGVRPPGAPETEVSAAV